MATLTEFLTGVANAIRTKKGTGGTIPAPNFASEILSIQTGTDTSDATAGAGDILSGKTAYGADGKLTGTIPSKAASDLTASGSSIVVPAGYYPSQVSKAVAAATQATPSISVSSAGLITASATQAAGYVAAGTKSATKQLTTQAAQTITPGTTNKTIASGRYLTGTQTIQGDANLLAANIKSGVSIFGVEGALSADLVIEDVTDKISTSGTPSNRDFTITTSQNIANVYGLLIIHGTSSKVTGFDAKISPDGRDGGDSIGYSVKASSSGASGGFHWYYGTSSNQIHVTSVWNDSITNIFSAGILYEPA